MCASVGKAHGAINHSLLKTMVILKLSSGQFFIVKPHLKPHFQPIYENKYSD